MPKTTSASRHGIDNAFAGDRLMSTLHKIRVQIYSETKNMKADKMMEYFRRKSKEFRSLRKN